jgi:hypothetical protein
MLGRARLVEFTSPAECLVQTAGDTAASVANGERPARAPAPQPHLPLGQLRQRHGHPVGQLPWLAVAQVFDLLGPVRDVGEIGTALG